MFRNNQGSSQAREPFDEDPDEPLLDEMVKESLTLLVMGTPVPHRARKRAIDWFLSEIQKEEEGPPTARDRR